MKKVLILSYYWPPSGGSGVQRWIRFCKLLKPQGWEPVIYTVKNADYIVTDKNLEKQVSDIRVLRKRIFEPYRLFSIFTRSDKKEALQGYRIHEKKGSLKNKIGWFIRGNLFIPDARCLWIGPSVRYLTGILKQEKFDAIISTGPPHSLHIIASKLKKKYPIPWIADFRDPWTSMGYYQDMPLTRIAHQIHNRLEKKCVVEPDEVIVVGETVQKEFFNQHGKQATVIHNGYDDSIQKKNSVLDTKFTIVHIGTISPPQNCEELWHVVARLMACNREFEKHIEIKLIGNTHHSVIQSIHQNGLGNILNHITYIPFHETQNHLFSAHILLLTISKAPNAKYIIPGKIFEYLKARRPILVIGPSDGDAASIVMSCHAGHVVNFNDEVTLESVIISYFMKYLRQENTLSSCHIERFSSTSLTKKLVDVLNRIT